MRKYLVTQLQGKRMTKKTTIDSVSRLAMKLTTKELATGASESSAELLQALDTVAKMLEDKAGNDNDIKALAMQVQGLVKEKMKSQ